MGKQIIYLKEQFSIALFDRNNAPIPFHEVGDDIGGIKLDSERDKERIEDIEKAIGEHRGGVYLATEEQYNDLKKKPIWRPSNPTSEPLAVFRPNRINPVSARQEDVAAADSQSVPPSRPIPGINPAAAAMLTQPGKPAEMTPSESGAAPPSAPPRIVKPRVGKASQKTVAPPPEPVTT